MDLKLFIAIVTFHKMFSLNSFIFLHTCIFWQINSWDLSEYGVDKNYFVSNIAVYGNRAFLALSRTECQNNVSWPTLIEVPWKQEILGYPILKLRNKILPDDQTWGVCEELQDVVALAIENKIPKLWILDKGNTFCAPKLLLYSVFQNDITNYVMLTEVQGEYLSTIVIEDFGLGNSNKRAFIGNGGENSIVMVSLNDLTYRKLNLLENVNTIYKLLPINADFLTISKTKPILYITEKYTSRVFSVDLKTLDESFFEKAESKPFNGNVSFLGHKLGLSTGLESDFKNGLIYYLVRDYAIVRWISNKPLQAEYHNVLAQSYEKLPYVSQIFTGPQYGIWALVNPFSPEVCYENEIVNVNITLALEKRVVKIMKYNKFTNNIDSYFN